jgi:hypothetical protein
MKSPIAKNKTGKAFARLIEKLGRSEVEAQNIVTNDGRLLKGYSIGAYSWCWDEKEGEQRK